MYVYISTNPFPGFYCTHSFTFTHTNVVQLLTSELSSLFKEKYFPTNPFPEFYRTLHQHHTSNAERNRISDAQIKQVCIHTCAMFICKRCVSVCLCMCWYMYVCIRAFCVCVRERFERVYVHPCVCKCARTYTHTHALARAHMHTDVLEFWANECRKVLNMRNCAQALEDRADIVYKV